MLNRAIDRRFIFVDDNDKRVFRDLLAEGLSKHEATVYNWVIMSNHFHLAVEVRRVEELTGWLGLASQRYSRHVHKRHGGSGPVWERRFKSILVQKQGYLGKLGRYIERNPVRAGMTEQAWDYPWSSARAYLRDKPDELVRPKDNHLYQSMGESTEDRSERYVQYLLSAQEREDDESLFRGRSVVIGDEEFKANVTMSGGRLSSRRRGPKRSAKARIEDAK